MKVRVNLEVRNQAFEDAFRYVMREYSQLFHRSLESVTLLRAQNHERGAGGMHIRIGGLRGYSRITVKNAVRPTHQFVEIIVHELTHLQQWVDGRAAQMTEAQLESEAYPAGWAASLRYREIFRGQRAA